MLTSTLIVKTKLSGTALCGCCAFGGSSSRTEGQAWRNRRSSDTTCGLEVPGDKVLQCIGLQGSGGVKIARNCWRSGGDNMLCRSQDPSGLKQGRKKGI